jgi:hypothetical protein
LATDGWTTQVGLSWLMAWILRIPGLIPTTYNSRYFAFVHPHLIGCFSERLADCGPPFGSGQDMHFCAESWTVCLFAGVSPRITFSALPCAFFATLFLLKSSWTPPHRSLIPSHLIPPKNLKSSSFILSFESLQATHCQLAFVPSAASKCQPGSEYRTAKWTSVLLHRIPQLTLSLSVWRTYLVELETTNIETLSKKIFVAPYVAKDNTL